MIITLFQRDILWGDAAANIRLDEELLLQAPKSDLYVLPEMWSTGFVTHPAESGITDGTLEISWMQQMAQRLNAAIAGSIALRAEDGTYRNRFLFVTPQGIAHYDKHHLFTYGGEHLRYTAGQERVIVEWRGVRFLLQVCYDLRFPIFSRNMPSESDSIPGENRNMPSEPDNTPGASTARDFSLCKTGTYDCILYVASWPTPRIQAWHTLLLARAIENQCYVCGVNRVGTDPTCQYSGGTTAVDPYGRTLQSCPDDTASTLTFTLDLPSLQAFRRKFPVLHDRD